MPLLGFDRERLTALRTRTRAATAELAAIGCTDPEAVDAMRIVATVRRLLDEVWLPQLDRVLATTVLDEHQPLHAPLLLPELAASGGLRLPVGWSVVDDPGGPLAPMPPTPDAVRTLADRLRSGDLDDLLDAELVRLTRVLFQIAADPALVTVFREAIGPDESWVRLFDALGARRLAAADALVWDPDDAGAAALLEQLDDTIGAAAMLFASGPHDGHRSWYPAAVLHMEPYSAALVIARLDLDADTLVDLCERVLGRWSERSTPMADQFAGGENTADLLFTLLAGRPAAATGFLLRAAARPALLFRTAQFDDNVEAVLLTGTDPTRVDVATAGAILRPLLGWLTPHGAELNPTLDGATLGAHGMMGGAIAPWLMYFGPRAGAWGWNRDDADSTLRWVLADGTAMDRLADAMPGWHDQLAATELVDDDGRVDDTAVHDLAALFAQLQVAFHDEEVSDAAAARVSFDLTVAVADAALGMVVPGGMVASVATDVGLALVGAAAGDWFHRMGIVPPTADESRRAARARFGSRTADTAVVAMVAVVGQLVDDGRLPPDALDELDLHDLAADGACAPATVEARLHDFVRGLAGRCDPATYNALTTVLYAFSNPLSTAQQCT